VERERGLEPVESLLPRVYASESHVAQLLDLKSRRRPPLSVANQVTPSFYLPPLASLILSHLAERQQQSDAGESPHS